MSDAIELGVNRASPAELMEHLVLCDNAFVPPLSGRVAIDDYAQKMTDKAMRFEAWHGAEMVGLVAIYCNDPEKPAAFISSVSVLPQWQGHGIASQLLAECVAHMRQQGFGCIKLEVDQHNLPAITLYRKYGFATDRASGPSLIMSMALGK